MDTHVRVWVTGLSPRSQSIAEGLLSLGHEVEAPTVAASQRDEASAAQWADVVLIIADKDSLTPDQALLFGLAQGAKKPVLFVGPISVVSPALAANSYTLIAPVSVEAIGFQVSTLGAARATRRSQAAQRSSSKTTNREPVSHGRRIERTSGLSFSSLLEERVYEALSLDPDVLSIKREPRMQSDHSGRSFVPDFLVWVNGAEPFNPIPVEVGGRGVATSTKRLVDAMVASNLKVGLLIHPDAAPQPRVQEPLSGLAVVQVGKVAAPGTGLPLSRAVREARNFLVHGGEPRG
jgi:hypothetical protein